VDVPLVFGLEEGEGDVAEVEWLWDTPNSTVENVEEAVKLL
jgi:hypothetical protein